ncbi:MAG: hypothetical protein K2X48_02185 [Chitinophagaceae bacterium]|nr:hypothetical protein [Chitinophagaceae bacterium]
MKRVVVLLIVLLIVLTGILYFGISSTQSFSKSVVVACSNEGALRVLLNERMSKKAWPDEKLNDSTYQLKDLKYCIGASLINTTPLNFFEHGNGELLIEQTTPDSSRFTLLVTQRLSLNPLKRVTGFFAMKQTNERLTDFLTALKQNFDGEELVYGIGIKMSHVTDSAMISTKKVMNHYPSVTEVYEMIDAIRTYIKEKGGEETSAPMLNVYEEGKNQYLVMVAVPTKTPVAGNETFLQKRMLANGFILVSEVTGGDASIKKGEASMQQFVMDHHKSSPAIPFQMLLTDRRAVTDTSKWKTRLYYPVMY